MKKNNYSIREKGLIQTGESNVLTGSSRVLVSSCNLSYLKWSKLGLDWFQNSSPTDVFEEIMFGRSSTNSGFEELHWFCMSKTICVGVS